MKHAGGAWSRAKAAQWVANNGQRKRFRIGMLLYGLVVIDFDTSEGYPPWAAEFPELDEAPAETTTKGVHVYFVRCAAADAAGLTDGPMHDPATGARANMDCKTIAKNVVNGHRSGALIVCAPSPNYAWLPGRSLLDVMPKAMSTALLAKVVAWRG